jgi:hypothetical protein
MPYKYNSYEIYSCSFYFFTLCKYNVKWNMQNNKCILQLPSIDYEEVSGVYTVEATSKVID